jgi:hypothetical protein
VVLCTLRICDLTSALRGSADQLTLQGALQWRIESVTNAELGI